MAQVTLQSQEWLELPHLPLQAGHRFLFDTESRNAFYITCEVSEPAAVPTAHLSLPLLFGGDFWLPCCLSSLVPPPLGLVEGGRWA